MDTMTLLLVHKVGQRHVSSHNYKLAPMLSYLRSKRGCILACGAIHNNLKGSKYLLVMHRRPMLGATDDASGIAVMLELIEVFTKSPQHLAALRGAS